MRERWEYSTKQCRTAYEMRSAGKTWSAIVAATGFHSAKAAIRTTKRWAGIAGELWPIPVACPRCGALIVTAGGIRAYGSLTCKPCKREIYRERYRPYLRDWKAANRAKGLCRCGRSAPEPGRVTCARCLAQERRLNAKRRRANGKRSRAPEDIAARAGRMYDLCVEGRLPWTEIAESEGYSTFGAMHTTKRYAAAHGLPWPVRKPRRAK